MGVLRGLICRARIMDRLFVCSFDSRIRTSGTTSTKPSGHADLTPNGRNGWGEGHSAGKVRVRDVARCLATGRESEELGWNRGGGRSLSLSLPFDHKALELVPEGD
ncbi:uncharacterized protein PV06_09103 [Exophiala oligosperma]|uniref:Uncharacterized protein n=1 Tax=Exophiala oligosperma TaxID=215243 RepID=A0A0D2DA26_9EURO|nr:uncharacterized protein PV06_09103 [Exophiala oligosperma]KIW39320.1 hypothetical protein PV06_09103 [Exophiala oligosperma]